jgi:hypothetical protein
MCCDFECFPAAAFYDSITLLRALRLALGTADTTRHNDSCTKYSEVHSPTNFRHFIGSGLGRRLYSASNKATPAKLRGD